MHNGVYAVETLVVAAHRVFRDHTADEFDLAVSYNSDAIEGNGSTSVIDTIVGDRYSCWTIS